MQDHFSLNEIKSRLKTDFIGSEIYLFDEIDSTNSKAKELAAAQAVHGTLVLADCQTAGRGRMKRKWFSPKGTAICMSILLRPDDICHQSLFTIISGIATVYTIRKLTTLDVSIKWPNDILLNKKKLAGILSEGSYRNGKLDYIIIGIGLNVHTRQDQFPLEIQDIATSMTIAGAKNISRCDMVVQLCKELELLYYALQQGKLKEIKDEWIKHAGMLGQNVSVLSGNVCVKGEALSINENGLLLVKTENGKIREVASGEIL